MQSWNGEHGKLQDQRDKRAPERQQVTGKNRREKISCFEKHSLEATTQVNYRQNGNN